MPAHSLPARRLKKLTSPSRSNGGIHMKPLVACGDVANSLHEGKPACTIHAGLTPDATRIADTQPSLEGREAICPSCRTIKPSSLTLPFFEFRGYGSPTAENSCGNCGYFRVAHEDRKGNSLICFQFKLRGPVQYDTFYCGCRGWD